MGLKNREYLGRLCFKDTDELVLVHPIVWFREDKTGGWVRLGNLFNINNLVLHQGSLAPTLAAAAKESVQELIKACIQEGADPTLSMNKPLTFSALVKVLEEKGLFKPLVSPISAVAPTQAPAVETALSVKHRAEVKNFILEEQRTIIDPISHQGNHDIFINVDPNLSVDLTNVEFVVETVEVPPHLITEEPVANTSEEALAALAVEHEKALESIKLLTTELTTSRAKVLQLENQIGSERGSFLSDLRIMISEILAQKFQALELDFAAKVGSEVRSEISRQTTSIMSEVSALTAIKSLSEATHSNVRSVTDFLTEVSESSSMTNQEITAQLRAVREDAKHQKDIGSRIETQLASNTSLLKELKDDQPLSVSFQTPAKS